MRSRWTITALILSLLGGLSLTSYSYYISTPTGLVCRPSEPQRAAKHAQAPIVLLWGNSLLFDHSWDADGNLFPVNCAVQGMTAKEAVGQTHLLPDIQAAAILVAFGTVELVRQDTPLSVFKAAMEHTIHMLQSQYPDALIMVATIPQTRPSQPQWQYNTEYDSYAFNEILIELEGARIVDISSLISILSPRKQTYDGAHLTNESYKLWENALLEAVGHQ